MPTPDTDLTLYLGESATTKSSLHSVNSYAEASALYSKIRDESGEGASTFPNGLLTTAVGETLRISYNGKIWRDYVGVVFDPYVAAAAERRTVEDSARMVERVSEAFRAALARALMPSQRAEIDRLNAAETTPGICHSHDFCDANMFMDEAMKACGITPLGEDGMTTKVAELWSAAWDHAKAAGFSAPIGSVERKPTPGPLVADFNSTMPNEPRFRVYSKTTKGNVGLFYAEADADLFAGAPDMLAVLRDAETRFSGFGGNDGFAGADDMLARIRAAIAKAEGRA